MITFDQNKNVTLIPQASRFVHPNYPDRLTGKDNIIIFDLPCTRYQACRHH